MVFVPEGRLSLGTSPTVRLDRFGGQKDHTRLGFHATARASWGNYCGAHGDRKLFILDSHRACAGQKVVYGE